MKELFSFLLIVSFSESIYSQTIPEDYIPIPFNEYYAGAVIIDEYAFVKLIENTVPCDHAIHIGDIQSSLVEFGTTASGSTSDQLNFWLSFKPNGVDPLSINLQSTHNSNSNHSLLVRAWRYNSLECPCPDILQQEEFYFTSSSNQQQWNYSSLNEQELIIVQVLAYNVGKVKLLASGLSSGPYECEVSAEIPNEFLIDWIDEGTVVTGSASLPCDAPIPLCGNEELEVYMQPTAESNNGVVWFKLNKSNSSPITLDVAIADIMQANFITGQPLIHEIEIYKAPNNCCSLNCEASMLLLEEAVSEDNFQLDANSFQDIGEYLIGIHYNLNGSASKLTLTPQNSSCDFSIPPPPPCEACIPEMLVGDKKYVVSCWVHEESWTPGTTSFENITMNVTFAQGNGTPVTISPTGAIIDGWQRMEGVVEISSTDAQVDISFVPTGGTVYVDDIRFFPYDGSMKSYVYDPETLWFVAELDERNYATFYEYDEEGKLARIKKETEKGIMTIQESRNSNVKE